MKPTAVYLMRNIWAEANYKVGIASVIDRRRFQIEETYQVAPVLVAAAWFPTKEAAACAERRWHKYFCAFQTDDHSGREWFALPLQAVQQFIEWSKMSPDGAVLKLQAIAGHRLPNSVTDSLISAIPTHERRTYTRKTLCQGNSKRAARDKRRGDELSRDSRPQQADH